MTVTIKDVAKLAGVSHQTVSRVINNASNVSGDARERVVNAINKLDYFPNVSARNIQKKKVNCIGYACPLNHELMKSNFFYSAVLSQLNRICTDRDIRLCILPFRFESMDSEPIIASFRKREISGVLLSSPAQDSRVLLELYAAKIPFTVIGRPMVNLDICFVDNNNVALASDAVERLLALGHTSIGLLNGPVHMTMSQDHMQGYRDAMKQAGCVTDDLYVNADLDSDMAYGSALTLLRSHPELTALLCVDEYAAGYAMRASEELGLSVPDDLSIISFSRPIWNQFLSKRITTYDRNIEEMGRLSAEVLLDIVYENVVHAPKQVPFSFLGGDTTAPPRHPR